MAEISKESDSQQKAIDSYKDELQKAKEDENLKLQLQEAINEASEYSLDLDHQKAKAEAKNIEMETNISTVMANAKMEKDELENALKIQTEQVSEANELRLRLECTIEKLKNDKSSEFNTISSENFELKAKIMNRKLALIL